MRQFIVKLAPAEGCSIPNRIRDAYRHDLFGLDEYVQHEIFLLPYLSMCGFHR